MTSFEHPVANAAQQFEQHIILTEQQVADRQRRSVKTLRNQRVTGGGVPFLKLGRTVRYRLCDVIAWETARLVNSTSEIPLVATASNNSSSDETDAGVGVPSVRG